MIELTLNGSAVDLEQGEKIVTEYQIAPISDISTRTAARSYSFTIPKTAKNLAAIQNSQELTNTTSFPYSIIEARLYVRGVDQNIRYASIESIQDEISVRLYGNNADFFSRIKGKKLSDLDLSSLDHFHYMTEIEGYLATTSGLVYAALDFHSDSPNSFIDNLTRSINVKYLLPSVYLVKVLQQMAIDAGFTLSGDILTDSNFASVLLPCREFFYPTTADFSFTSVPLNLAPSDTVVFRIKGENLTLKSRSSVTITKVSDGTKIVAETQADEVLTAAGVNPTWVVIENDSTITYPPFTNFSTGNHTFTIDFQIENTTADNDLEVFEIEYSVNGGAYQTLYNRAVGVGYSGFMGISGCLGDMKQDSLLKVVAQMFGLLIDTNPQTKVVTLYQLQDVVDRIGSGYDWSEKIDRIAQTKLEFRAKKYGQINDATYQEDETVNKKKGTDYFFEVSDENLPFSKDVFKSPFAATNWRLRFIGIKTPQIKIFESAGTSDQQEFEPKPRILVKTSHAYSLTYTDGSLSKAQNPFVGAYFLDDETFNLGWQKLIELYSTNLVNLLDGFKVITERVRLNESDINQLDMINPVWIDEHGAWFLISRIRHDHSSGESSEVELVKLQ